jgi:hypothetical protein
MSDTVEAVHNKIVEKIAGIKRALETIREVYRVIDDPSNRKIPVNILLDDINELENSYNFATVDILTRYYNSGKSISGGMSEKMQTVPEPQDEDLQTVMQMIREISVFVEKPTTHTVHPDEKIATHENIIKQYYRVITAENYIARINEHILRLRSAVNKIAMDSTLDPDIGLMLDKANRLLTTVNSIDIQIQTKRSNYEKCSACGVKMDVVPSLSELKCSGCGRTKPLYGTVFEDHQFYNQEGQKTKHGTYDPNRHFRFWMDRIQAKEHMTFPQSDLNRIETIINKYYPPPMEVNCAIMRNILKEAKLARYNDHIPLLVKIFTGKSPPQLTHNETRTFFIKFNKIMEIYEQVVKPKINNIDGNRPYYPYFIYKIAEDEFKDNPEKLKILEYIHLQSEETIIKHDLIYKQICENASEDSGLVYKTTNSAERRW